VTYQNDCMITLSVANVSKTFKQVNIHKAAGPDRLPGRVLRATDPQMTQSLLHSTLPFLTWTKENTSVRMLFYTAFNTSVPSKHITS
jgi:hypothetical protein